MLDAETLDRAIQFVFSPDRVAAACQAVGLSANDQNAVRHAIAAARQMVVAEFEQRQQSSLWSADAFSSLTDYWHLGLLYTVIGCAMPLLCYGITRRFYARPTEVRGEQT